MRVPDSWWQGEADGQLFTAFLRSLCFESFHNFRRDLVESIILEKSQKRGATRDVSLVRAGMRGVLRLGPQQKVFHGLAKRRDCFFSLIPTSPFASLVAPLPQSAAQRVDSPASYSLGRGRH